MDAVVDTAAALDLTGLLVASTLPVQASHPVPLLTSDSLGPKSDNKIAMETESTLTSEATAAGLEKTEVKSWGKVILRLWLPKAQRWLSLSNPTGKTCPKVYKLLGKEDKAKKVSTCVDVLGVSDKLVLKCLGLWCFRL
jgi:hypothetical protein